MPIVDITNLINLNEGSINLNKNPILIKKVNMICVHTSEGDDIPHFHIKRDKMHDCCVMLTKSMFFNYGNNDSLLNSKESSQLNTWLLKPNKATPNFTNWQVLANMWNAIPNARFTVDLNKQPDYSTIYPYK